MGEITLQEDQIEKQLEISRQVGKITNQYLKEGVDYGTIPGCGEAKTLFLNGAQKLPRFFGFHIIYHVSKENIGESGHMEASVRCEALTNGDDKCVGEGVGSCSTLESKYRYRRQEVRCPVCGKEAIIKGKQEYGGGWVCYTRKGGCNAKFKDDDESITSQKIEYVEHENPADYRNTVLKMAKKRAYVDCVKATLGLEFTQDLEDIVENLLQYDKAKGNTGEYTEIMDALEAKQLSREDFTAYLKQSYGKDVDIVLILNQEKERILEDITTRSYLIAKASMQYNR